MKLKISTAEQLSTHFKSLRKARGWSQADLGKRIGLKQARVAQIEGDPGSISVEKLLQVLHALEADFVLETRDWDREPEQTSTSSPRSANWTATFREVLQSAPETLHTSPARSLNLIGRNSVSQATSTPLALNKAGTGQADAEADEKSNRETKD